MNKCMDSSAYFSDFVQEVDVKKSVFPGGIACLSTTNCHQWGCTGIQWNSPFGWMNGLKSLSQLLLNLSEGTGYTQDKQIMLTVGVALGNRPFTVEK